MVIEAWPYPVGESGTPLPRPVIRVPVDNEGRSEAPAFQINGDVGDIWVIGLEITSAPIPPTAVRGAGFVPVEPKEAFVKEGFPGSRFLFEDLYIHDVSSGFDINGNMPDPASPSYPQIPGIKGLTIRRCIIQHTWSRNLEVGFGHPQGSDAGGAYLGGTLWTLVEENFMDQVGWSHLANHPLVIEPLHVPAVENSEGLVLAPKTVFNHGLYVPASSEHVLIRNNIVARPSHNAIQSRGSAQRVENNLVLNAPVGISLGHAQNQGNPNGGEYKCNSFPSPCPCSSSTLPCAHYEKFWRGQCAYNVVMNGANVDEWIYHDTDPLPGPNHESFETDQILINGNVRGRGITISRSRMQDRNGNSFNYCERTKQSGPDLVFELVNAGEVFRNLILNNEDGREAAGAGIYSEDDQDNAPSPAWIVSYQALIHDNIVYNWLGAKPTGSLAVNILNSKTVFGPTAPFLAPKSEGPLGSGFRFVNNHFIQDSDYSRVAGARWNPVNVNNPLSNTSSWVNNLYFSRKKANERYLVQPASPVYNPDTGQAISAFSGANGWQIATGETTAAELHAPPAYSDPDRNLYTYMQFELGLSPSTQSMEELVPEFMNECATQGRGKWRPGLTANAFNTYMRAGFGITIVEPTSCPQ